MANITLTYKGLTGVRNQLTIDDGQTMLQLITAIAADESNAYATLVGGDYDIVLERDKSITDGTEGSSTLASLGIVDNDVIICCSEGNGTKEVLQNRKLRIAAVKKEQYFDSDLLPTKYSGDTLVDNTNTGGLATGRPFLGASISIADSILDDAFVYLDAGATESYPGSGNTWFDLSGNDFDATLFGSPNHNDNRAIDLDGGNNYATLPTGFSDSFANGFGLFAIWNFGTAAYYERIIDLGQGAADDNIIVGRKQTSDTFFYQLYNGSTPGTFVEVDNAIQNSTFASYGVSINGTDGRLYVNGELEGTEENYTEVPTNVSRDSNFIGESNWSADSISSGEAGVLLIFRRALTADEMASLHNSFAARYGLTQV